MWKWYNMNWNQVVDTLKSDVELGVATYEIEKRRDMYGVNIISTPEIKTLPINLKNIVISFWSIMTIITTIGMIAYKFYLSATLISLFYAVFIYVLIHNKLLEQRKYDSFQTLNRYGAVAIRDGRMINIDARDLVVGDIVVLEKGKYVPADIRLIKGIDLKVNELAVTGEAYEVEKYDARIIEENIESNKINNILFKGTVVTHGNGTGIVVSVGDETEIGKIIKEVKKNNNSDSILFNKWSKIMNVLYGISLGFTAILVIINILRGEDIDAIVQSTLAGISAVNIMPIAVVFFGALQMYFSEMKKRGVTINRIESLEEFADIDMIFCDKEGVICSKEYEIKSIYTNEQDLQVKSTGKVICKNNLMGGEDYLEDSNVIKLVNILDMLNEGIYDKDTNKFSGEDFEIATCKFLKNNYLINLDNVKPQVVLKIPINNERRVKTIVTKKDDKYIAFSIGTIENMINMCTHKFVNGIEMLIDDKDIENLKKKNYDMSKNEMIPYGVAYRIFNYEPSISENIESNMVLSGVIGVINTIESDNYSVVPYFIKNDIRTVVNCKENKVASTVFGKIIGAIKGKETSVLGAEIEFLDKSELERIASVCNVYSNMKSSHKVIIAETLSNMGKKGIYFFNKLADLPLMKYSKVNISYGDKISNIVKSMSDITINNDVLNNTVNLMSLSKSIVHTFSQLNKYIFMYASAIYSFMIFNLIFNNSVILTPDLLAIINFVMLPIIIIAISLECKNADNINKIPKKEINKINDKDKSTHTFIGISISLISVIVFAMLYSNGVVSSNLVMVVFFLFLLNLITLNFSQGNIFFKSFFANLAVVILLAIVMAISNINYLVGHFDLEVLVNNDMKICLLALILIITIYSMSKYYFKIYLKNKIL